MPNTSRLSCTIGHANLLNFILFHTRNSLRWTIRETYVYIRQGGRKGVGETMYYSLCCTYLLMYKLILCNMWDSLDKFQDYKQIVISMRGLQFSFRSPRDYNLQCLQYLFSLKMICVSNKQETFSIPHLKQNAINNLT